MAQLLNFQGRAGVLVGWTKILLASLVLIVGQENFAHANQARQPYASANIADNSAPAARLANDDQLGVQPTAEHLASLAQFDVAEALASRLLARPNNDKDDDIESDDRYFGIQPIQSLQERQASAEQAANDLEGLREARLMNAHLPANNPFGDLLQVAGRIGSGGGGFVEELPSEDEDGDELSPPVNEPPIAGGAPVRASDAQDDQEDQEDVELSELTSRLNAEWPNSLNRTRALLQLLEEENEARQSVQQAASRARQEAGGGGGGGADARLRHLLRYLYETQPNGARSLQPIVDPEAHEEASEAPLDEQDFKRQQQQQQQTTTTPAGRYGASEYIDHPLALAGHQYVQGGAGEGRQLLGPDGTFENVQVIKSDSAVPSYCDPPNPCPLGYTAENGCLEHFVNSASFSREFQAKQQCSCDNEHSLFNCASPPISAPPNSKHSASSEPATFEPLNASSNGAQVAEKSSQLAPLDNNDHAADDDDDESNESEAEARSTKQQQDLRIDENDLDTLARTVQNRLGDLASVKQLIQHHEQEMLDEAGASTAGNQQQWEELNDNMLVRSARKWSQQLNSLARARDHEDSKSIGLQQFD